MSAKLAMGALIAALALSPALAQDANAPVATDQTTPANLHKSGQWRATQLIGLDVYNDRDEKLGDIKELLVDRSGKVSAAVIGVGGFLGMGERNVLISMDKLRFSDEPRQMAADSNRRREQGTTGVGERPAEETASKARTDSDRWFPDHAMLAGATRDSLKAMPEFKYD